MGKRHRCLAIVLAAIALASGARADLRAELEALRKERYLVEEELFEARMPFKPELDASGEKRFLEGMGKGTDLNFQVKVATEGERVLFGDSRPSPVTLHAIEVSGRGSLPDLGHFVRRILDWDITVRIPDVLRFESDGNRSGTFAVTYLLPVFGEPEPPPAISGGMERAIERERATIAGLRETKSLLEGLVARSKSEPFSAAVTAIDAVDGQLAVSVTGVRAGEDAVIEGAVVGADTRVALFEQLGSGGLRVTRLAMPASGACRPFVMTVAKSDGGASKAPAGDTASFESRTAALCAVEPLPSLGRVVLRGGATGADALSLHFRDAKISLLFFALHSLTGAAFVVDSDVRGTVDVDIDGATLDETLAAMRSVDVVVRDGPLRRVSRAGARVDEPPAQKYAGEKVSITLNDADLRDVLCLFQNISGLQMLIPSGFEGETTIHAEELPWDAILDAAVRSAGLTYAIDGTSVFIGTREEVAGRAKRPGSSACGGEASSWVIRNNRPLANQLEVADLTLAGVAGTARNWQAYAYGPWRQLNVLAADSQLFDGKVTSVGPEGVVVSGGKAGKVELRLKK